jgi:hypothetical protein
LATPGIPPASCAKLLLVGKISHSQVDGMLLDLWVGVVQVLAGPVVAGALYF